MKQPVQLICLSLLPICIQCSWLWWFWKWCWWKWKDDDYHVGIIYIVKKGSQQTMKVTTITAIVLAACTKDDHYCKIIIIIAKQTIMEASSLQNGWTSGNFCWETMLQVFPEIHDQNIRCYCTNISITSFDVFVFRFSWLRLFFSQFSSSDFNLVGGAIS